MSGVLSESVVLKRSRAESLEAVKNINCWGCNLTDVSVLQKLPNLTVVDLSCNNISSLSALGACRNLTELYLRRNKIIDVRELKHLTTLSKLQVLWLEGNALVQEDNYRAQVISLLPQLKKLDNQLVTESERMKTRPATRETAEKQSNVLRAVFCLLEDLNTRELSEVEDKLKELKVATRECDTRSMDLLF